MAWRSAVLQPCLCDVWHDHVLFEGDAVTGLVDYGGVKVDNVATDLARLLGSLAGDDPVLRDAGLRAYSRLRPLSLAEEALVPVLDRTGTLLGIANWLRLAVPGGAGVRGPGGGRPAAGGAGAAGRSLGMKTPAQGGGRPW